MLDRLSQMTSDVSSEGRRELLNAITDLFLVDEAPTDAATEHFAQIADHSLGVMSTDDKAVYARKVAAEAKLPNAIAKTLASDEEYAVAHLVLKLSPVLTDADLAAIAVTHSQSHLVAIAERATLSETVTDILVERGDQKVLRTVSGNDGAQFSDGGLNRLIARGGNDRQIASNLAGRSERLPAAQAHRVLQIAAQLSSAKAPEYGTELISGAPAKTIAREAREKRLELRLLIADLKEGVRQLDDVVTTLVREDRAFDLAQVISTFSDIPNSQILRALLQKDSGGIAVACRSVGLGAAAYQTILELRAARLGLPKSQIDSELATYEKLPAEMSERAVRFLKMRSKIA